MSAASSAHPTNGPDPGRLATVHTFPASRPPRRHQRRENPVVPPAPTPSSGPGPELGPHEQLAATLEDLFAGHRRSLTDEHTVQDFLITLGAVRDLLSGALTRGVLDEGAHQDLDAMIAGMMAAPGLLAGNP